MVGKYINLVIRSMLLMLFVGTTVELATTEADARAGGGRSMGRSSGRPASGGFSRQQPRSQPQAAPRQQDNPNTPPAVDNSSRGGGFMRGMAGGMAGGFLGSMLFNSMGHAAGGYGAGVGGGGIGLLEIILLGALAYFGFKWWKGRQQPAAFGSGMRTMTSDLYPNTLVANQRDTDAIDISSDRTSDRTSYRALEPMGIDSELASDIFFKVQGAWTRRDLSVVKQHLGKEMQDQLEQDLSELKQNQQINRLENISVRRTDVSNSWEEDNKVYSAVKFTANLLDYTVNEKTGQVVAGSDSLPVKFEEDWTFAKEPQANTWQLVGIQQA